MAINPNRRPISRRQRKNRKPNDYEESGNFNLEINCFGPVSKGNISIKPLTVFIGPNQSGKSYAAMLIHSIYNLTRDDDFIFGPLNLFDDDSREMEQGLINEVIECHNAKDNGIKYDILRKCTKIILTILFESKLSEEIGRLFASPLNELRSISENEFNIIISTEFGDIKLKCTGDQLEFENISEIVDSLVDTIDIDNTEIFKYYQTTLTGEKPAGRIIYIDTIIKIQKIILSKFENIIGKQCYYLPAARSGILQGHKALSASMFTLAPYAGLRKMEIPTLSGIVSDFITSIIDPPLGKGPLFEQTKSAEENSLHGEVIFDRTEKIYPEIKYCFMDKKIPLHRASSTVSELAPIFLYLKYTIQPGDILIIEEPEAHLHPENQRIMATFLVNLIRNGVRLIITTHSEYMLEQLSNFVLFSQIDNKKLSTKYERSQEDYLKIDEIAVYAFGPEGNGNKVRKVDIDQKEGIPSEEFAKITELLYEETVKISRDISNNTE